MRLNLIPYLHCCRSPQCPQPRDYQKKLHKTVLQVRLQINARWSLISLHRWRMCKISHLLIRLCTRKGTTRRVK